MEDSPKLAVEKMLAAFAEGNIAAIVETVSEDSWWVYYGTQIIPRSEFKGREGVQKFFSMIFSRTELLKFETEKFLVQDNMVVVLGNEHQKIKRSGKELKQKWVQIYTVENGLITKMEEFATSEVVIE